MYVNKISLSRVRPLPYYNTEGSIAEKRLAAALRQKFVPKVKRLLPGHHLGGFTHGCIVRFVSHHKQLQRSNLSA